MLTCFTSVGFLGSEGQFIWEVEDCISVQQYCIAVALPRTCISGLSAGV